MKRIFASFLIILFFFTSLSSNAHAYSSDPEVFISEIIATVGLLNTIILVGKQRTELVAVAVGMYIGAA